MIVRNLSEKEVRFQVEGDYSTLEMPQFKTIFIGVGCAAEILGKDWDAIVKQEGSVEEFTYTEEPIAGATMKNADGKTYTPTMKRAFGTGNFRHYNMIEEMVRTRTIELVKGESQDALRAKFEGAAKALGIKVTKDMSVEDIKAGIRSVKEALELV